MRSHKNEILSTFCPQAARHSYSYGYERPMAVITNMQSVVMKRKYLCTDGATRWQDYQAEVIAETIMACIFS
jgi:hypothetical protein